MNIERIASVPLIVHDPYFSIWSPSDCLYETDTLHWSGAPQRLYGYVTIDGARYRFMGGDTSCPIIEQKSLNVLPTATVYIFENEKVELTVRFTSPLLPDDMLLLSRPCTYVDFTIKRKQETQVSIDLIVTADLVHNSPGKITGGNYNKGILHYGIMRKAEQHPLGHSGDKITIDWGDAYLAAMEESVNVSYDPDLCRLIASADFGTNRTESSVIIAYDDLLSIFYFGSWRKAYWTKKYTTILEAIEESFQDKQDVCSRAMHFDDVMEAKARAIGGADYALLCSISFRQVVGAHKLIEDESGTPIFLSKENDSNGCIGTVDVSYPSIPLFLLFNTEYVKGMLRPIFRFASCSVWEYDFAPHDVGRYPYAAGQVYGLNQEHENREFCCDNGTVFPFYYQYPVGSDVYDLRYQMPIEECGNMVIMTAAVCTLDGHGEFAEPYYHILKMWTDYLISFGADPGGQLCTDDFAGHLSHNVNLSAKAVMGIEAFSRLAELSDRKEEGKRYHEIAVDMAKNWEMNAREEDHYRLAFNHPNSWSLKYNLIWDKFFHSKLFSQEVFEKEISYYLKKRSNYGIPLDSRKTYTKSDWILWCAAFAPEKEDAKILISSVAEYVKKSPTRVPFSDWYETENGEYCQFIARSVQGGIFMPMLIENMKEPIGVI